MASSGRLGVGIPIGSIGFVPTPPGYDRIIATGIPTEFLLSCNRCAAVVLWRTIAKHNQWHEEAHEGP